MEEPELRATLARIERQLPPWGTPALPQLVGSAEACDILGVQKMTLSRWMKPGSGRGAGFPPDDTYMVPPRRIGVGAKRDPVWTRQDVERFRDEYGRHRAPAGS
jgi:hypothetical protein